MDLALRPMSTSQILDRTFQLYRRNFVLFAGIATLPPALLLVAQLLGLIGDSAGPKTDPSFSTANIAYIAASGAAQHSLLLQMWEIVAGFCASTLAGPIATISIALIYYDERVRKEAFDLQLMMEAVGMQQPAQARAAGTGPAPA